MNIHVHPTLKRHDSQRGFTLVELMVSLTVFSIVMTVSVGTLLVLIDLNAKAQALYSATTNLSFALDSMTREIRTGYHYVCGDAGGVGNIPARITTTACTGGDYISLVREKDDKRMEYRLNGNSIEQRDEDSTVWMPITADEVFVESFSVTVENPDTYNEPGSDEEQPTVDIMVRGYVNNGLDSDTDFYIQTHIIQRRLDII